MREFQIEFARNGYSITTRRPFLWLFTRKVTLQTYTRLIDAECELVQLLADEHRTEIDRRRFALEGVKFSYLSCCPNYADEEPIYTALVLAGHKPIDMGEGPTVARSELVQAGLTDVLGRSPQTVDLRLFERRFAYWYFDQQPDKGLIHEPRVYESDYNAFYMPPAYALPAPNPAAMNSKYSVKMLAQLSQPSPLTRMVQAARKSVVTVGRHPPKI